VPKDLDLHLVLDNYATHKTPKVKERLIRHPRFHLHLTPTSSSWLNLVERWFAELTTPSCAVPRIHGKTNGGRHPGKTRQAKSQTTPREHHHPTHVWTDATRSATTKPTNPASTWQESFEPTVATVRHRAKLTKGPGFRTAGLAKAFKLIESAQACWRALNAPHLVALVRPGARFDSGKLVERPDEHAPPTAA
jgi:hypothetical protein